MANARLADRAPFLAEVDVLVAGAALPRRVWGTDVSEAGMFLRTNLPLRRGDRLSLRFEVEDRGVHVRAAEVAWQSSGAHTDRQGVGVRFLVLDPPTRAALRRYVRPHLALTPDDDDDDAPTLRDLNPHREDARILPLPEPAVTLPPMTESIVRRSEGQDELHSDTPRSDPTHRDTPRKEHQSGSWSMPPSAAFTSTTSGTQPPISLPPMTLPPHAIVSSVDEMGISLPPFSMLPSMVPSMAPAPAQDDDVAVPRPVTLDPRPQRNTLRGWAFRKEEDGDFDDAQARDDELQHQAELEHEEREVLLRSLSPQAAQPRDTLPIAPAMRTDPGTTMPPPSLPPVALRQRFDDQRDSLAPTLMGDRDTVILDEGPRLDDRALVRGDDQDELNPYSLGAATQAFHDGAPLAALPLDRDREQRRSSGARRRFQGPVFAAVVLLGAGAAVGSLVGALEPDLVRLPQSAAVVAPAVPAPPPVHAVEAALTYTPPRAAAPPTTAVAAAPAEQPAPAPQEAKPDAQAESQIQVEPALQAAREPKPDAKPAPKAAPAESVVVAAPPAPPAAPHATSYANGIRVEDGELTLPWSFEQVEKKMVLKDPWRIVVDVSGATALPAATSLGAHGVTRLRSGKQEGGLVRVVLEVDSAPRDVVAVRKGDQLVVRWR